MKRAILIGMLCSSSLAQAFESEATEKSTLEMREIPSDREETFAQEEALEIHQDPEQQTENLVQIEPLAEEQQQTLAQEQAFSSDKDDSQIGFTQDGPGAIMPPAKTSHSTARQKILQQRQTSH